jgi:GNAT superfamily N-acetyltransferase
VPSIKCEGCDEVLEADDFEAHVVVVLDHYTEAHPQFGLSERQVRNYLERMPVLSQDTERLPEIGEVEVVRLGPELVDDVLQFFDRDAFAGNPAWASCYCMAHHIPGGEEGDDWSIRSWRDNRDDIAERIRTGETQGVVARCDGQVVAWCNASPRCKFPDYARNDGADDTTGVVTCFVVAPTHRGHGLARQMLAAVLEHFPTSGITAVEAHPANDPTWAGAAYRGTIPLYREHGFEVVHEGTRATVVRREL